MPRPTGQQPQSQHVQGATKKVTGAEEAAGAVALAGRVTVPATPGALAAVTCVVPLQLFAYQLALVHGTNPDSFRSDDPGFPRIEGVLHL